MRAAAILGPGITERALKPFREVDRAIHWNQDPRQADAILIFGGDGTLHRHLPDMVEQNKPVLIVPAGSGNDFARTLNLKTKKDSLTAWKKFATDQTNVKTIDLGTITPLSAPHNTTNNSQPATRYFATVAGLGLDTEVARRANQLPRWLRARGGYILSLLPALTRLSPFQLKLETDSPDASQLRTQRSVILAAFANTPTYGSGMKIAPTARPDDAQLDICIIRDLSAFKLFCLFPTVYSGSHTEIREVDYFQARSARIETDHPLDVYADGEYVCQTPAEIGVVPRAFRVITL